MIQKPQGEDVSSKTTKIVDETLCLKKKEAKEMACYFTVWAVVSNDLMAESVCTSLLQPAYTHRNNKHNCSQ